MRIIKDPKSYERNKKYYYMLKHILSNNGSCLIFDCRYCPFHYLRHFSIASDSIGCNVLDVFPVDDDAYIGNKMYYSAMLLSCYTKAERLTYMLQEE